MERPADGPAPVTELPGAVRFEHPAWEQQSYETDLAFSAAEGFFLQGRARTVQEAWQRYREARGMGRVSNGSKGYQVPRSFRDWRIDNHWDARARLYDEHEDAVKRREREEQLQRMAEEQAQDLRSARIAATEASLSVRRLLASEEGRAKLRKELDDGTALERLKLAAYTARLLPQLIAAEREVAGIPDEETLAALTAATEGPMGTQEDDGTDEDPIRRILDDPHRTSAAAWSVLPSRKTGPPAS